MNKINLTEMKDIIDNKKGYTIIDARTKNWDDGNRIPGAISLPADTSPENFKQFLSTMDKPTIVYCSGGQCPAARILAENLTSAGYSNVREYEGGLKEWRDENKYSVELS